MSLLIAGLGLNDAQGQYKNGIGLRAGLSQGLTVKHFFNETLAVNGLFSSRGSEGALVINVMMNKHYDWNELFEVEKGYLSFFYGYGAHLGSYGKLVPNRPEELGGGLDASIGMEYVFESVPFVIAVDYRLIFDVGFQSSLSQLLQDPAFSVRYTF